MPRTGINIHLVKPDPHLMLNAVTFRNCSDYRPLLENMVFMHLRRNGYDIEYVNTKAGFETDFFARHKITDEIKLVQG